MMVDWKFKIEENEDEIKEAIGDALRHAYLSNIGIYEVLLFKDGKVSVNEYASANDMSESVLKGDAIKIVRFDAMESSIIDSLDTIDYSSMKSILKDCGCENYISFLGSEDDYDSISFYFSLPESVKDMVDDVIIDNEINNYMIVFYPDWIKFVVESLK